MILSALLVVIGLLLGMTATQYWDLRLSGVIVVPLFAIYTLYDFEALPVLLGSVVIAYWGLSIVTTRTLLFGRRLLYVAILFGALVPLLVAGVLSSLGLLAYSIEMYALGSILPGIAAYNMHRVDRELLVDDIVASVSAYLALVVIGAAFVSRTTARWVGDWSPVLFASGSDVAQYREAGVAVGEAGLVHDPLVGLAVVLLGVLVAMVVETVWSVRLLGIIALPLLALFITVEPVILAFYVTCALVTFAIIQLVHQATLLYGRVLLSLSVMVAILLSVPAAVAMAVPGHHLLFVSLLAGIGAYNVHRLSWRELQRSIVLSGAVIGLFVLLIAVVSGPPPVPGGWPTVVVLAVASILPGGLTAIRLEQRRRRDAARLDGEVTPA